MTRRCQRSWLAGPWRHRRRAAEYASRHLEAHEAFRPQETVYQQVVDSLVFPEEYTRQVNNGPDEMTLDEKIRSMSMKDIFKKASESMRARYENAQPDPMLVSEEALEELINLKTPYLDKFNRRRT